MNDTKQKTQILDLDYTGLTAEELLGQLKTSTKGLGTQEAEKRLEQYGFNETAKKKKSIIIFQILSKFVSPLVVVLLIIAVFSLFFGEKISALLVMLMAIMSVALSFSQEYRAGKEVEKLSEMVRTTSTVYRDGKPRELPIREIVPGDIVDLFAGDMIPADLRIISCKDLFLNQASLTGESFPAEKVATPIKSKSSSVADMANIVFMGSSVVSGSGLAVVIKTGLTTQFGKISRKLAAMTVETNFDKGIRKFTWVMLRLMFILAIAIFAINAYVKGNITQAFLFALAVAVGLTPEMLPMLVSLNLSKGAIAMSKKKVIVKRLNSIQNFGAMDILCSDKTGTLTIDKIVLERHCDVAGTENKDVLRYAFINSYYQTGLKNILDRTILNHEKFPTGQYKKIDEIPFDFSRKIMSVVVEVNGKHQLIAKGAPEEIYKRCAKYELEGKTFDFDDSTQKNLKIEYEKLSSQGFRVLAVAYKDWIGTQAAYSKNDEQGMTLNGYIAFLDPPKTTARTAIDTLRNLGIDFKVLTGDNELITKKICGDVGLNVKETLTGEQVEKSSDDELKEKVKSVTVFSRLSPFQKERIINILRANGHTVGFMGDGINDALALKAADVGISVDNAVDIAKESADVILLQKSLMVLGDGVVEGRRTFGNIIKYIKMGSSSNFGNMFSMTGASLFLPFLPMLPIQILLNNFLYDLSQVAIPSDDIDEEYLRQSRPWNVDYIKKFMVVIGPISSVFDFITFGVLWFMFHATQPLFNTGWFLESLLTQTLVIHIIRTNKIPFIESKPSQFLIFTSIYIVTIGLVIPFTPLGQNFGFVIPPASFFLVLPLIIAAYLFSVQVVKTWFIKKYGYE